jgi:hypothetical protein
MRTRKCHLKFDALSLSATLSKGDIAAMGRHAPPEALIAEHEGGKPIDVEFGRQVGHLRLLACIGPAARISSASWASPISHAQRDGRRVTDEVAEEAVGAGQRVEVGEGQGSKDLLLQLRAPQTPTHRTRTSKRMSVGHL